MPHLIIVLSGILLHLLSPRHPGLVCLLSVHILSADSRHLQGRCFAPLAATGLMLFALVSTAATLSVWQSLIVAALVYLVSVVILRGISGPEAAQGLHYILGKIPGLGPQS